MLLIYLVTFAYRERHEIMAAEASADSESVPLWRLRSRLQHFDTKDLRSRTFKRYNEESLRNIDESAKRMTRWTVESPRSGAASPFSVHFSSEMNAASSPEDSSASELDNSSQQGDECIFSMFLHYYFIKLSSSSGRIFVFHRDTAPFYACLHMILK
jgi:hypothetical protein